MKNWCLTYFFFQAEDGIRDAEWIVRMDGNGFRLRPDEFIKVVVVTNHDVFFRILAEQKRLDHAQSVGNILGSTIRPRFIFERLFGYPPFSKLRGNRRREHLFPDTVVPLA